MKICSLKLSQNDGPYSVKLTSRLLLNKGELSEGDLTQVFLELAAFFARTLRLSFTKEES